MTQADKKDTKQFDRLESLGLWKETDTSQKREVIVSFGKSSLVLYDIRNFPLTHWSFAALRCIHKKDGRMIYTPDQNSFETLEISDDTMNRAIQRVCKAVYYPRPHRGRIRVLFFGLGLICLGLLSKYWLPEALARHTSDLITQNKAQEIGKDMTAIIQTQTGPFCQSSRFDFITRKLESRLKLESEFILYIAHLDTRKSVHLPGGIILVDRSLIENFSQSDILAGYVLMEQVLYSEVPPFQRLFLNAGILSTLRFLTTGELDYRILKTYVNMRITSSQRLPDIKKLQAAFQEKKISSQDFARVFDPTLETTQALMKENTVLDQQNQILSDQEWLTLQSVCDD